MKSHLITLFITLAATVGAQDIWSPKKILTELRANRNFEFDDLADYVKLAYDSVELRYPIEDLLETATAIADSTGNLQHQAHVALGKSVHYNTFGYTDRDLEISTRNAERARDLYEQLGMLVMMSRAEFDLSIHYAAADKHYLAEAPILHALQIWQDSGFGEWLGEGYTRVVEIYYGMEEPEKMIEYSEKSLALLGPDDDAMRVRIASYLAAAYNDQEDYQRVIDIVTEAMDSYEEVAEQTTLFDFHYALQERADAYYDLGRYPEALADLEKSGQIFVDYDGDPEGDVNAAALGLALFYAKRGERQQAQKHFARHEAYAQKISGDSVLATTNLDALSYLKQYAREDGDYPAALRYSEIMAREQRQRDSSLLLSLEAARMIEYETQEKEIRIAAQQEELSTQRTRLLLSTGGLLAALVVGAVLYVLTAKLRKRNAQNERLVAEKETLIGEIHHRVKNNLQVISSLLQLQSRSLKPDDARARDALLEGQNRVQAMGLIHQKLYQGDEVTSVNLPDYVEELGETLLDAYRLDDRIEIFYDVDNVTLDVDTAIPLGLIINELVTNSLKYAFPQDRPGTIEINIERNGEDIFLTVSDDGVGKANAPVLKSATSFGTNLIELLSKKLKGQLTYPSVAGYATRIHFPSAG